MFHYCLFTTCFLTHFHTAIQVTAISSVYFIMNALAIIVMESLKSELWLCSQTESADHSACVPNANELYSRLGTTVLPCYRTVCTCAFIDYSGNNKATTDMKEMPVHPQPSI